MSSIPAVPGLTIVLPTKAEAGNLEWLFGRLHAELDEVVGSLEILVIDYPTGDGTEELCARHGVRYIGAPLGFAAALRRGFSEASHELLVTMDADGSHDPVYIRWMLREIPNCDLVICSRYVPRGGQESTFFRYITSRILNLWMGNVCSMPVQDLSGGFKMYRRQIFREIELLGNGFEIQCEITIKAFGHGFHVREIPFVYKPRKEGRSKAAFVRYGMAFLKNSLRLRRFRNSMEFCDYDERAYRSRIPLQMHWQQTRYQRILDLLPPKGRCLDVGCGSGRLIVAWPHVVGLDCNEKALRYLSRDPRSLCQGSADALPFADASFDQVYCCDVIEHLPREAPVLRELVRVLRPGGRLLISTPDYSGTWPGIEWLYRRVVAAAYDHIHVTRYTAEMVETGLAPLQMKLLKRSRMFGAIAFLLFEKPRV